jgi:hypothetical protein
MVKESTMKRRSFLQMLGLSPLIAMISPKEKSKTDELHIPVEMPPGIAIPYYGEPLLKVQAGERIQAGDLLYYRNGKAYKALRMGDDFLGQAVADSLPGNNMTLVRIG